MKYNFEKNTSAVAWHMCFKMKNISEKCKISFILNSQS